MTARISLLFLALVLLTVTGCHSSSTTTLPSPPSGTPFDAHADATAANKAFLSQKTFDPWVLTSTDPNNPIPTYLANGKVGWLLKSNGTFQQDFLAGHYNSGKQIMSQPHSGATIPQTPAPSSMTLNLQDGTVQIQQGSKSVSISNPGPDWKKLWQMSDVVIAGDPEAQQVTHANLFYLLSSTAPGSTDSIPPLGLSSGVYSGHIFWDAEVWMLPALLVQHPDYAKSIVDYRFKLLPQAKKNAKAHGFAGAEYPWESADTGAEVAPAEFAQERHITADVAFAAWQYYLWTGDKTFLQKEGWPLLQATAQYWVSRVTHGPDGKYHITKVMSPDETAGVVDDDAYTNAVVQYNLRAAAAAAPLVGQSADPRWKSIADALFFPFDKAQGVPAEHVGMTDKIQAKQADVLLLVHPLGFPLDAATQGKMLDFYTTHTMQNGPAMTSSINAVVAARLGHAQQSLDEFHNSYRPFERAPWDAFSEKRTTNNVYFMTGMAGCVQSVLYGFAGLQVVPAGGKGIGTKLTGDAVASLYADPHLPPGWAGLMVKGIHFRGKVLDLTVGARNKVTARVDVSVADKVVFKPGDSQQFAIIPVHE